jgi:Lar family restriction alleviation protein
MTTPERSDAVSEELKSCPHCGEEAEIDTDAHNGRTAVYCSMCGHRGFIYEWMESEAAAEQKAIAAWNSRAPDVELSHRRAGEHASTKDAEDAARYRWLRDRAQWTWTPPPMRAIKISWRIYGTTDIEEVDSAIDSAIASEAGAT